MDTTASNESQPPSTDSLAEEQNVLPNYTEINELFDTIDSNSTSESSDDEIDQEQLVDDDISRFSL